MDDILILDSLANLYQEEREASFFGAKRDRVTSTHR
jgi:hypothetical protein